MSVVQCRCALATALPFVGLSDALPQDLCQVRLRLCGPRLALLAWIRSRGSRRGVAARPRPPVAVEDARLQRRIVDHPFPAAMIRLQLSSE